jgi:hypothetical protein
MKKLLVAVATAAGISCVPMVVAANERVPEGAMGAAAGAIVGGPVGAVAGGVIGFGAGPNIRRGLGIPRHHYYRRYDYRDDRRSAR